MYGETFYGRHTAHRFRAWNLSFSSPEINALFPNLWEGFDSFNINTVFNIFRSAAKIDDSVINMHCTCFGIALIPKNFEKWQIEINMLFRREKMVSDFQIHCDQRTSYILMIVYTCIWMK